MQGDAAGQGVGQRQGRLLRLVGGLTGLIAAEDAGVRSRGLEPRLQVRRRLQAFGRAGGWPDQAGDRGLSRARLGGDLDLEDGAAVRLDLLGERQRGLEAPGQGQAGQAQARRQLLHPRPVALAQPRERRLAVTFDPQAFRLAVDSDHPPRLARAAVEVEPAAAHRRYPRPSSSIRVS